MNIFFKGENNGTFVDMLCGDTTSYSVEISLPLVKM